MFKDPTNFIILNAVVVTILVVYFLSIKKNKGAPTRLKMKNKSEKTDKNGIQVPGVGDAPAGAYVPLNVMFNYNGHSFDAYETLGVPAGSNYSEVKQAYKENCASVDEGSREFYETAFKAISISLKK